MDKERMLDVFRFMCLKTSLEGTDGPIRPVDVRKGLKQMGLSIVALNQEECGMISDALNTAIDERWATLENVEKELELIIDKRACEQTGSSDPQQTAEKIKTDKRLTDLFKELSDIGDFLRITEDVLSMTTTCLLDRCDPDYPCIDIMEQVSSSMMVVEDRLQKVRSNIESLPLKFKEGQPE